MIKSGITREELIQWGGEEVFNQALAICNSGDVLKTRFAKGEAESIVR